MTLFNPIFIILKGYKIGSGSSKGKSLSLHTQVNGQTRDLGCYIK